MSKSTQNQRDTFKYQLKSGNKVLHCGITNDLDRRLGEHQRSGNVSHHNGKAHDWKDARIVQVGRKTTREAAHRWERINSCNANW